MADDRRDSIESVNYFFVSSKEDRARGREKSESGKWYIILVADGDEWALFRFGESHVIDVLTSVSAYEYQILFEEIDQRNRAELKRAQWVREGKAVETNGASKRSKVLFHILALLLFSKKETELSEWGKTWFLIPFEVER